MPRPLHLLLMLSLFLPTAVGAAEVAVPMVAKSTHTFYISGRLNGLAPMEFMVDTGSGYMTINEQTLAAMQESGGVRYQREIRGILANGSELIVPIYSIASVTLGEHCQLTDVEAAVFPGRTRQILGMSVLNRASPFLFSVDPPQLQLSNCHEQLSRSDG